MASKAKLKFCPLEYMYHSAYGIMPDYDIDRHIAGGMPPDEANALVNGRLNDMWKKMKYEHEHREEIEQKKALAQLEKECPF